MFLGGRSHSPNHIIYADLIAHEIRLFGGSTFANLHRGEGPRYYEIVCDVAKNIKAPYKEGQDIEKVEESIISTILEKAWEKMSDDEKTELLKEFQISNKKAFRGSGAMLAQWAFRAGGFKSYQLLVIVANAISKQLLGKGLAFGANAALAKAGGILTGPIGVAITALWTILDLAGPSYKVTIPSVIYIAALRVKYNSENCTECEKELPAIESKFCPHCGVEL